MALTILTIAITLLEVVTKVTNLETAKNTLRHLHFFLLFQSA